MAATPSSRRSRFSRFHAPLLAASLLLALAAAPAHADEAGVRKGIASFIDAPESVIESVTRIPQGGLYEIVLSSGELIYTDDAVSFIFAGNLIDTRTRQDITRARLEKLSMIDFKTLPLNQAVKRVNGNGKRVIATFEDPNCDYCKQLGRELQKVKNVTIYTFLYPILSANPAFGADSDAKSRNIWCAKDKAAAWVNWVVDGKEPEARNCDSSAIERNMTLGRKLRIHGTPTLFFADGTRLSGYRSAEDFEQILEMLDNPSSRKK